MALALLVVARVPLDVPVQLGREEAQRLARIELTNPVYSGDQEPWAQKVLRWLIEKAQSLIETVGGASPLGWFGIVGVIALVALVALAVRRRTGRLTRATTGASLFGDSARTAADLRTEAERYAAAGAWAEAVRARLRAVVRELEERGLVDARPGRTADEIARDAGRALPSVAADLRAGARLFDDVWYGGRAADPSGYARLVALDDAVSAARPGGSGIDADRPMAVPR